MNYRNKLPVIKITILYFENNLSQSNCIAIPFALSMACPELVEGRRVRRNQQGFDKLSPNGQDNKKAKQTNER